MSSTRRIPPETSPLASRHRAICADLVDIVGSLSAKLTAKHLSVAVNAVVGMAPRVPQDVKNAFFEMARARASALYAHPVELGAAPGGDERGARSESARRRAQKDLRALSLTLNGLSKARVVDHTTARVLGARIAGMVQEAVAGRQPLEGQYLGLILNAYSRAGDMLRRFQRPSRLVHAPFCRPLAIGFAAFWVQPAVAVPMCGVMRGLQFPIAPQSTSKCLHHAHPSKCLNSVMPMCAHARRGTALALDGRHPRPRAISGHLGCHSATNSHRRILRERGCRKLGRCFESARMGATDKAPARLLRQPVNIEYRQRLRSARPEGRGSPGSSCSSGAGHASGRLRASGMLFAMSRCRRYPIRCRRDIR